MKANPSPACTMLCTHSSRSLRKVAYSSTLRWPQSAITCSPQLARQPVDVRLARNRRRSRTAFMDSKRLPDGTRPRSARRRAVRCENPSGNALRRAGKREIDCVVLEMAQQASSGASRHASSRCRGGRCGTGPGSRRRAPGPIVGMTPMRSGVARSSRKLRATSSAASFSLKSFSRCGLTRRPTSESTSRRPSPVKQVAADLLLEALHRRRQRGLGDPAGLGRAREAPCSQIARK